MEHRRSRHHGKPTRRLFSGGEEADWPKQWIDALGHGQGSGRQAARLKSRRRKMAFDRVTSFATTEDLVRGLCRVPTASGERPGDLGSYWLELIKWIASAAWGPLRYVPG